MISPAVHGALQPLTARCSDSLLPVVLWRMLRGSLLCRHDPNLTLCIGTMAAGLQFEVHEWIKKGVWGFKGWCDLLGGGWVKNNADCFHVLKCSSCICIRPPALLLAYLTYLTRESPNSVWFVLNNNSYRWEEETGRTTPHTRKSTETNATI